MLKAIIKKLIKQAWGTDKGQKIIDAIDKVDAGLL